MGFLFITLQLMPNIAIISPSVRNGRKSHRIALYFLNLINEMNLAESEILDLLKYNFPLFNERLKYIESPSSDMITFSEKIKSADGVIIISPEYNGGSPASLKNAIDLLTNEWRRKPVAFVTVSDGNFGGTQAIISLQFTLWKLGALTVPAILRLPNIISSFDENGVPAEKQSIDKRGTAFVNQLLWQIEAKKRMF
jgi:NAD(P)H-dependent FMN reductase